MENNFFAEYFVTLVFILTPIFLCNTDNFVTVMFVKVKYFYIEIYSKMDGDGK